MALENFTLPKRVPTSPLRRGVVQYVADAVVLVGR